VVVDASVAVQGFAHEPGAEAAARPIEDAHVLVAPDLMAAEAATAWWKRARLREMEPVDVQEAVVDLSLALAVERGASLATADERLRRAAVRLALPVWSVRARVGR
jgi:predicted nucleic acid-binding protein